MNNVVKTSTALAAFALFSTAVFAQTSTPPPVPQKQGLFSKLFHPKPKPGLYQSNGSAMHPMGGHSMMSSHSMVGGKIIGNKNSHVYHLPGDKGSLPAPQNRVYFSSVAAAQAAGYHAAGSGHSMTSHSTMMHSPMVHH